MNVWLVGYSFLFTFPLKKIYCTFKSPIYHARSLKHLGKKFFIKWTHSLLINSIQMVNHQGVRRTPSTGNHWAERHPPITVSLPLIINSNCFGTCIFTSKMVQSTYNRGEQSTHWTIWVKMSTGDVGIEESVEWAFHEVENHRHIPHNIRWTNEFFVTQLEFDSFFSMKGLFKETLLNGRIHIVLKSELFDGKEHVLFYTRDRLHYYLFFSHLGFHTQKCRVYSNWDGGLLVFSGQKYICFVFILLYGTHILSSNLHVILIRVNF